MAIDVMNDDLMSDHWKKPPPHNYAVDWVAQLDPSKPLVFKPAMHAAPRNDKLRSRLHEVLQDNNTDEKLKETVCFFLWSSMNDNLARDKLISDLHAKDFEVFETAVYDLTDLKFSSRGPSIIPQLQKVLSTNDMKRRLLVIANKLAAHDNFPLRILIVPCSMSTYSDHLVLEYRFVNHIAFVLRVTAFREPRVALFITLPIVEGPEIPVPFRGCRTHHALLFKKWFSDLEFRAEFAVTSPIRSSIGSVKSTPSISSNISGVGCSGSNRYSRKSSSSVFITASLSVGGVTVHGLKHSKTRGFRTLSTVFYL
ncbi:MAG: hypothetical protein IH969_07700 [Candidatus Krumholzibacteriota bacterium]|nr:hypothetical protein [Candidatus Krumholzibacteriota bacterium]